MIDSVRARLSGKWSRGALAQLAACAVFLQVVATQVAGVRDGLESLSITDERVVIVVIAATVLLGLLRTWFRTRDRWRVLIDGTDVPRVEDVSRYRVGVKRSIRADRYREAGALYPPVIERMVQSTLYEALRTDRFVLVVGNSGSGASTVTDQALRRKPLKRRRVLVCARPTPERPAPLAALLDVVLPWRYTLRETILVVDDIGRQLQRGTLTLERLHTFQRRHRRLTIVATIRSTDYWDLGRSTDDAHASARALVESARAVRVPPYLYPAEIDAAERVFTDLTREQLRFLPRYMLEGEELTDAYLHSLESAPHVYAVTSAAVDWTRCGMAGPAPQRFLRAAAPHYIRGLRNNRLTVARLRAALDHAATPVAGDAALIEPAAGGWNPSPLLVEQLDEHKTPIPPEVMELVFKQVLDEPADLIALGMAAVREGLPEIARRAWRRVGYTDADAAQRRIAEAHREQLDESPSDDEPLARFMQQQAGSHPLVRWWTALGPAGVEERADASASPFDPTPPRLARGGRAAALYRRKALRALLRVASLATFDLVAVLGGLALALVCKSAVRNDTLAATFADFRTLVPYAVAFALPTLALFRLYDAEARRADLPRIGAALAASAGLAAGAGLMHGSTMLSSTVAWASFLFAIAVCWTLRAWYDRASVRWVQRHGLELRVLFVGARSRAFAAARGLAESHGRPMRFVGYVSTDYGDRCRERLGLPSDLDDVIASHQVHAIVLTERDLTPDVVLRHVDRCLPAGVDVYKLMSPEEAEVYDARVEAGQTLALKRVRPKLLDVGAAARKRLFDLAVCIALASPVLLLMAVIAVLVKLTSPGPVFVPSYRRGRYEKRFWMRKFRTTRASPAVQPSGLSSAEVASLDAAKVTPLGAALRRYGLDELPQFLHVLRGQMSVVGPRPLPEADFEQLRLRHRRRYLAKPGLTGLWQVSRRRWPIDYEEMARADLLYISNWSVRQDVAILLKTIPVLLSGRTDLPSEHP